MINNDIDTFFNEEIKQENEDIVIGIDLGTSNSCCSIWKNNKPIMIPDENGKFIFPSIIAFDANDNIYSCNAAVSKLNENNYFYETKRLIGRNYDDPIIQSEKKILTYDISSTENNNILIKKTINGKEFKITPEEVSSYVLSSIKISAEKFLKQEITKAVITVPAYFNDNQRQATKDAARIAGFDCQMILCEPIASALAYGIINRNNYRILVYDFGGGTLDISVLQINDGIFEVKGTSGNMHLGGLDFDKIIYNYCLSIFLINNSHIKQSDLENNLSNINKKLLLNKCELAKKELSTMKNAVINIQNFYDNKDLSINLSRNRFYELCNRLLTLSMAPINTLFESIDINKNEIDEIILVGGMCRVPIIQENIEKYFEKKSNMSMNPNYIVAIGAGIQSYLLSHPDTEFSQSIILLNTTSLSLGIEVSNEIMDVIIPKNSLMPTHAKKLYTNNSTKEKLTIKLFEGERTLTKDNYLVGEFDINVESAPIGTHQIEINVSIDINGIITLTATNLKNNNKTAITINGKNKRLSENDIKKIIEESKKYKLIDKHNKKYKELQNHIINLLDNLKYNLENDNMVFNNTKLTSETVLDLIHSINITGTIKELKETIKYLNETLCILIMSPLDTKGVIESINKEPSGTSVYQDETLDEEFNYKNNIIKKIDDENIIKIDKSNSVELLEILSNKCVDILNYLDNIEIDIDENRTQELKQYIEDIILYIHTKSIIKNDELEAILLDVDEKYNNYIETIENIDLTILDELIILCKSIQKSILFNANITEDNVYIELIKTIDNIFELYEEKIKHGKNEILNNEECLKYIDYINNQCEYIVNIK